MKRKIHSILQKTILFFLFFLPFSMNLIISQIEVADECSDIGPNQILEPITDPNFQSIDYVCALSTLEGATPDTIDGCPGFLSQPTVWFKVETDDIAAQMFTTVETSGSWNPVWSVFTGNCDSLNVYNLGAPPCSSDDASPDLHQTGIDSGWDTYIAVTADPYGPPIDYPEFEICAATIINVVVCLGHIDDNCVPDPSVEIKIIDREYADLEPDVDIEEGYMGPFCQGEELDVHIEFFYDATETGVDWLIGFVPDFGSGWDIDPFDFTANPASATGGNGGPGEWLETGSDCEGRVAEPFPHLCTYTDELGNLRLCNALCESCPECDDIGMNVNDPLPNGYFWLSDGGNTECVAGSCISSEQWGIGSVTSQLTWDFSMSVKEFDSLEECLENNDLQISFQTFSDGGAGCWEDPVGECLIDRKQLGPQWMIQCTTNPQIIASQNYIEIQSGESINIDLSIVGGGTENILVTTSNEPYILGNNEHVFSDGTGTITDTISLVEGIFFDQEIKYFLSLEGEEVGCGAFIQAITVKVFAPAVPNDFCMDAIEISFGDSINSGLISTTQDTVFDTCEDTLQNYSVWFKLDLTQDSIGSDVMFKVFYEDNYAFNLSLFKDGCDGEFIKSSCQYDNLIANCIYGNVYYIQISAETEIPLFQFAVYETDNNCCFLDFDIDHQSEICEGDLFYLPIELIDGPGYIEWEFEENPNVIGQSAGMVYEDQYNIEQHLYLNDSVSEPQQLFYYIKAYKYDDEFCPTFFQVHTVTIYPDVEVIQEDLIELCFESLDSIDIRDFLNREDQNFEYFWQALDDHPDHFGFGHLIQLDDSYNPSNYQFKINITDNFNCTYVDTLEVIINEIPEANFDFVIDESTVTFSNLSTGINSYEWHFGDGQYSMDNEPIHSYSAEGDYEVILVANNFCGSDTITINLTIDLTYTLNLENKPEFIIQPNPNQGDFDLKYKGLQNKSVQLEIIDLSGVKLENDKIYLEKAMGKMQLNEPDLSPGIYFLRIIADGEIHILKWVKI